MIFAVPLNLRCPSLTDWMESCWAGTWHFPSTVSLSSLYVRDEAVGRFVKVSYQQKLVCDAIRRGSGRFLLPRVTVAIGTRANLSKYAPLLHKQLWAYTHTCTHFRWSYTLTPGCPEVFTGLASPHCLVNQTSTNIVQRHLKHTKPSYLCRDVYSLWIYPLG